jgi:argininosuccinate lyase
MLAAASRGFSTATDLADWLVRVLGVPFRDAHHITGALVAKAEKNGTDLDRLSLEEMQSVEKRITREVYSVLGVENSVNSRVSFGGTAPANVRKACEWWRTQWTQAKGKGAKT